MTRRPLSSWVGLALLVGGALAAPWLRLGSGVVAQEGSPPILLAQRLQGSPMEPPLAPGMAAPRRGGNQVPGVGDPADPPAPQVTIRVRVPALAHPDQELEYRILVQNVTQSPAHHVRVRTPLPSNSTRLRTKPEPDPASTASEIIWQLGTLAGGESRELSLVVKPTGAGDVQCCARVQFEHGECVRTRLTQPDLRVRFLAPTQAAIHDIVTIQLEVTNAGQRDATGVVLTNPLVPEDFVFTSSKSIKGSNPLTWDLGTIAPGKSLKVEYQAMVARTGTLVNKAEVKDAAGAKLEASCQVVVGEPKLSVAIAGPNKRIFGRPTTFQISVSNPGTQPATNVELRNDIPTDIKVVSATRGWRLQGNVVSWKLGTLTPGAKQTVQLTLQANKPGRLGNRPVATADRGLSARAELETAFEGATGLALEIDKNPDPLEVGQKGTYTFRLLNQGSAAAKNPTLTVTMPPDLQVLDKGTGTQDGAKVIFTMESLAAGGEAKYTITAQALRAADARLRAEVTSADLSSGPIHFEENVTLHNDVPPLVPQPPK